MFTFESIMNLEVFNGLKFENNQFCSTQDALLVEHPLKIAVNGKIFTVTMQTPGNEMNLVRGLLYTENVYTDIDSVLDISVVETSKEGYISKINVDIDKKFIDVGIGVERNQISVSSCGVCGKTELSDSQNDLSNLSEILFSSEQLNSMFNTMNSSQPLFESTGGSHACSAFNKSSQLITTQEDVGRHNAVDKVIGTLLLEKKLSEASILLVSGRISYEIVAKCIAAKIPILAAVSAPSTLAVDLAQKKGITLIGFCRNNHFTIYTHKERIRTK